MVPALSDSARSTADLAANLTDQALEILAATGMHGSSVAAELKLWHTLRAELDVELRWRRLASGLRKNAPLGGVLQRLVHRAVRRAVAEEQAYPESEAPLSERACGQLCLA